MKVSHLVQLNSLHKSCILIDIWSELSSEFSVLCEFLVTVLPCGDVQNPKWSHFLLSCLSQCSIPYCMKNTQSAAVRWAGWGTVPTIKFPELSAYAFHLMDCLTFFRGWTRGAWDARTANGSWGFELDNSRSSSVSDMLQSACVMIKVRQCGSNVFYQFKLPN